VTMDCHFKSPVEKRQNQPQESRAGCLSLLSVASAR
jgi:hypothetical protein